MKKILAVMMLLVGLSFGQYNPYSTSGWDLPYSFTGDTLASPIWSSSKGYYGLGVFTLGSNPGGWLNRNFWKVDSLMESLVVYTDTTQLAIINDTLRFNATWIADALLNLGGVNKMQFIPTDNITAPYSEGLLWYDSLNHAPVIYLDEPEVTQQLGQEVYVRVYNSSVSTIANGAVVSLNGTIGNIPSIQLADITNHNRIVGIATHSIEASTYGYVTKLGTVNNVNTLGMTAGQVLYIGVTPGSFTTTRPPAPNREIAIGTVLAVSATTGSILVDIPTPDEIDSFAALYWYGGTYVLPLDKDIEKKITNATNTLYTLDADITHGISMTADNITMNETGGYKFSVSLTFQGGASGVYKAYLKKNTTVLNYKGTRSTSSSDTGNMGFVGAFTAVAGDVITLWVINTGSVTDFTCVSGNLVIEQIR